MKKIILSCTLLLTACANNQVIDSQIESAAMQQATQSTITPEQAIKRARAKLATASKAELTFYTPLHFNDAQRSLEKIEDMQKNPDIENQSQHKLLMITEAFKAERIINKGFDIKETIMATLADALAHKVTLEQLGSHKEYPSYFNNIVDDLIDLFKLIEKNNVEKARKEQAHVLADMTDLEIKTLIKQHVIPAINILDKAEDNDADNFAELTYEQAEITISRAKKYISANYRNRQGVANVGKEAVTAARRALTIGSESKSIIKLNEEDAEQKALEIETLLGKIATGLAMDDITGLSFREQAIKMAEHAEIQKQHVKRLSVQEPSYHSEIIVPLAETTDIHAVENEFIAVEDEVYDVNIKASLTETELPAVDSERPVATTESLPVVIEATAADVINN